MVNTHFHWDHWHGNEVYPAAYPGAEIITNQLTREAMVHKGLKRIQDHVRQVPAEVAKLRAELAAATTTEQRAKLQADLRLAESYLAEVRALKPALPTMAFERTMKLYRRDREIQLLYLGRAHTEGDVFVYLPKEQDGHHRRRGDRLDALHGRRLSGGLGHDLDRLAELDFDTIIMGHGDAGGPGLAPDFPRRTSTTWWRRCGEEVATGASLDEVKQRVPARAGPDLREGRSRPTSTTGRGAPGLLANIERTYAMVS